MRTFLQFQAIVLAFIAVRSGHLAFQSYVARDTIMVVLYGVVALLALIAAVLSLLGG